MNYGADKVCVRVEHHDAEKPNAVVSLLDVLEIHASDGRHDCCEFAATGLEALGRLHLVKETAGED